MKAGLQSPHPFCLPRCPSRASNLIRDLKANTELNHMQLLLCGSQHNTLLRHRAMELLLAPPGNWQEEETMTWKLVLRTAYTVDPAQEVSLSLAPQMRTWGMMRDRPLLGGCRNAISVRGSHRPLGQQCNTIVHHVLG